MIAVQEHDFDVANIYAGLLEPNITGAATLFVGRVRDFSTTQAPSENSSFYLQHYPGMTEKVLEDLEQEAHKRWDLINVHIVHRVGQLNIDDQIVIVGVSSKHRKNAFAACEFLIDTLKTTAPFWKKEGDSWVEAKRSDSEKADTWKD